MDEWMNDPKAICPSNFFQVGVIITLEMIWMEHQGLFSEKNNLKFHIWYLNTCVYLQFMHLNSAC